MRVLLMSLALFLCSSIMLPSLVAQVADAKWQRQDSTDIPAVVTISPDNKYVGVQTLSGMILLIETRNVEALKKRKIHSADIDSYFSGTQEAEACGLAFSSDSKVLIATNIANVTAYSIEDNIILSNVSMKRDVSSFGVGASIASYGKPLMIREPKGDTMVLSFLYCEYQHSNTDFFDMLSQKISLDIALDSSLQQMNKFSHSSKDDSWLLGYMNQIGIYSGIRDLPDNAKLSSSSRFIMRTSAERNYKGEIEHLTQILCSNMGNMPCKPNDTSGMRRFYGNAGYAMTKDDERIAIGSNDSVIIYSTETRAILQVLRHQGNARVWEFSDNDSRLVSYDEGCKRVLVWDVAKGAIIHQFDSLPSVLTSLSLSADGRLMAIGLKDGTVALYDANTITAVNDESKDFAEEQGISVSPQPVTSHCTIKGIATDVREIAVYNLLGECVYSLQRPSSVVELPLSAFGADGIYTLCALSPRGVERCSIILSR